MTTSLAWNLLDRLNPVRLAGPIFDKELRVSSRQRRFYLLRVAYIGLLMAVMIYFWLVAVRTRQAGSAVVQVSRMSEAGKQAVLVIVWFQFITGQLLALALFSGAIGSEIRQRSLDVLLVTPITSVQIVIGKFLSKLLQLGLLLAVSLPLLAAIRVFGGVPWDYVVASLCVTVTSALFIGAMSLLFSISQRQVQQAFSGALSACILLWFTLYSASTAMVYANWISPAWPKTIARLLIPFAVMLEQMQAMLRGGRATTWPWHCLIMLGATAVLLLLSIWRVRRAAALRIVSHQAQHAVQANGRTRHWPWRRSIRRVTGSPLVWKERCRPLFQRARRRWLSLVLMAVAVIVIVVSIVMIVVAGQVPPAPIIMGGAYLLWLIFFLNAATGSASAIPREKEARTWPILLTTPLGDGEIVRGQALGILRRNLPLLLPIPFLVALAFLLDSDGLSVPGSFVLFVMGWLFRTVGGIVFLMGIAFFLGTCVKTTTIAVVATFAVYVVSRMILPVMTLMMFRGGGPAAFPVGGFLQGVVYSGVGIAALHGATRRVRRNIFT